MRPTVSAIVMDLAFGLSLGLYYTITYYGRALTPLPGLVALGAPFMYYVAVDERFSTVYQAWLWMACFPVAGALWRLALAQAPRLFGERPLRFRDVTARLWHVSWPLLVPIPLTAWLVSRPSGHCSWSDFIAVCLRQHNVESPAWLPWLFMPPALLAFALEMRAVWRLLAGLVAYRRIIAITAALVAFVLAVCLAGFAITIGQHGFIPPD
jgi:hypothetical protein